MRGHNAHRLYLPMMTDGAMYIYPFGAVVMHDMPPSRRDAELAKLRTAVPKLTAKVVREDYTVLEDPALAIGIDDGMLRVDLPDRGAGRHRRADGRAKRRDGILRESSSKRCSAGSLRRSRSWNGAARCHFSTRPLHRIIGEAITARSEVLSVLHLLDKPDEAWDDPAMDRIYDDSARRV